MRPAGYGLCLSELDRYNEAENALLEAHQRLKRRLSAQHERTIKAIAALADLYAAWAKMAKATEWWAKLPEADEEEIPTASGEGSVS